MKPRASGVQPEALGVSPTFIRSLVRFRGQICPAGWARRRTMARSRTSALHEASPPACCIIRIRDRSTRANRLARAPMESLFSSLKTERTARKVYRSRDDARARCSPASSGPAATALETGLPVPRRFRGASHASLTACLRNRQQANVGPLGQGATDARSRRWTIRPTSLLSWSLFGNQPPPKRNA